MSNAKSLLIGYLTLDIRHLEFYFWYTKHMESLRSSDIASKIQQFGYNELPPKPPAPVYKLILEQFKSPLTYLLIAASVFSFAIGDPLDGVLIIVILLLNSVLGFYQEYKASRELDALKKMEVTTSRVIRDGNQIEIPSRELVPGDIIVLESGDKIPADALLIEAYDLSVNESSLTGESLPVVKSHEESKDPGGSQSNKLFFGTSIVNGRAKAQVAFTGKHTRFGKLALTLSELEDEKTPLEKNLSKLAKTIAILAFITSTLLFSLRLVQEIGARIALLESIALLVAAVPEGLPTAITFILVMGVRRMYHKKTLVRKLSAIESLGSTTVICTDKTGTLTQNKLSVTEVSTSQIAELIKTAVICNSAQLVLKEDHGAKDILGDETEGALLFWAEEQKAVIDQMRSESKIVEEMPFDSKTRMMAVLAKEKTSHTLYIKGAPETILPLTSLSETDRKAVEETYQSYAEQGLRVLAFAYKPKVKAENKIEKELTKANFVGLMAIADTIRPEAILAVTKAQKASIKVVMITGDNELTAKAIGEQVGILKPNDEIMLGAQLEELSDEELDKRIRQVAVFARCIPEHKLRIVQSYQRLGDVVAVTGDGVNDALALKQAQIGVAMGKIGTDVAKEASDMVIQDDNFATLVDAIEEGRLIYSNILKTVKFLMAGNLSEVLVIFLSGLLGFPPLLQPAQILWINFVTDGLPALTLAFDKSSTSLMNSGPRSRTDAIVGRKNLTAIAVSGVVIALVNLGIFIAARAYFPGLAQTIVFCTIVITQIIFVMILRKDQPLLSNKYFIYSVIFVLLLQGLIVFIPGLRELFHLETL